MFVCFRNVVYNISLDSLEEQSVSIVYVVKSFAVCDSSGSYH